MREPSSRPGVLFAAALLLPLVLMPAGEAAAGCPPEPKPLCREFPQSTLRVESGGRFTWKGTGGPASERSDLGAPGSGTPYLLCAYDDRGLVVAADIPEFTDCPGGSCWSERGETRLRYEDRAGEHGDVRGLAFAASDEDSTKLYVGVEVIGGINLPLQGRTLVQLWRGDSPVCFEGAVPASSLSSNDRDGARGETGPDSDPSVPPLASFGCLSTPSPYPAGTSVPDGFELGDGFRSFRVRLPASYRSGVPLPLVFQLHGDAASGEQLEDSSQMVSVAAAEGFILVSPDGDGAASADGARAWRGGDGAGTLDDVVFLAAVLDVLEWTTCIDRRRIYAVGDGGGGTMALRLGCDLADRVRAVATLSAADPGYCEPLRPVPHEALGPGRGTLDYASSRSAWEFFSANPPR